MQYTGHKNPSHTDTFGIVSEARAACLDSAGLYIPFDQVVKDGSVERLTLG